MRIFSHSDYNEKPWDYIHNGYISAPSGMTNGVRARGVSSRTTLRLADAADARMNSVGFEYPRRMRDHLILLGDGHPVTLDDPTAEDVADWLTTAGVEFTAREA